MDLTLRQVRAFVSVAQLGSFTRAAALLNVSQPALTVQIRRLEDVLAVRLLDRNSRSVEPTRAGRELLVVFQRVLRELDHVVVDTRDLAAQRYGVVRIACLPSFAAGRLADAIAEFRSAHPRTSFVVKDVVAQRALDLVRREDVDLGVTGGDVSGPDIQVLQQTIDTMHVVYPVGHPIGDVDDVGVEALMDHPIVLTDVDTSVRAVVDAAFVAAGRLPIVACEATYMMTAVGMVRAGLGVTILPSSAREILAEPTVRSRPITDPRFSRPISLIKKAGRTLPMASETFAQMLALIPGDPQPSDPQLGDPRR